MFKIYKMPQKKIIPPFYGKPFKSGNAIVVTVKKYLIDSELIDPKKKYKIIFREISEKKLKSLECD